MPDDKDALRQQARQTPLLQQFMRDNPSLALKFDAMPLEGLRMAVQAKHGVLLDKETLSSSSGVDMWACTQNDKTRPLGARR